MHISSPLLCSVTIIFRTNYHYRCRLEILRNTHYSKYIYIYIYHHMTKNQDPLFEQTSPSFTLNGNNSFLFLLLFFVSFQIYLVSGLWTSLPCYKYVSWLFCGYLMLVPWKRCRKKATWTPENPILPTPKKPMDCSSGIHKHRQHNGLLFLGQMMSWGTFQGRWWAGGAYPLLSPRRGDMIVYVMVNWNSMICASFGAYKIPHIPQRSAAYTYSWISKSNKWNPVITPFLWPLVPPVLPEGHPHLTHLNGQGSRDKRRPRRPDSNQQRMKNVMPKGQTSKRQTFVCKAGVKHSNFWLTTGQYMMTWATCSMRFTLPQSIPYKCLQNMRQSFTLSQLPNDRAESQSNVWDRHELHNYPSIINDTITLFPLQGLTAPDV